MAIEVIMPKAGMDMQEGQIASWNKSVGEYVEKGEVLLEIVTDKVNMEVEAEESGYLLHILRKAGEVVPVIETIAYLGEKDEKLDLPKLQAGDELGTEAESEVEMGSSYAEETAVDEQIISSQEGAIRATPKARKYARDNSIDLNMVKGTQDNGRISYIDVFEYVKNRLRLSPVAKNILEADGVKIPSDLKGSGIAGKVMKSDVLEFVKSSGEVSTSTNDRATHRVKMDNMRSVIAKRMKESYLNSPVVHYNMSVNMAKADEFISENKELLLSSDGIKLGINDLILMSCSKALHLHPYLNSRLDEENAEIVFHDYVDLAMAVSLDDGLLTPVIRDAHKKSLSQLARSSRTLSRKARDMKLSPDELQGSTFTISNIGMYGVETFTPIINQPNTAILGVGSIVKTPYVVNDEIKIVPIMQLSLSADHRIVDGVVAAKFMQSLKKFLENPISMLL